MRTSTIKSIAAIALTGAGSALVLGFKTSDEPTVDMTGQADTGASTGTSGSTGTTGSTGNSGSASGTTGTTNGSTGTAGTTSSADSTAAGSGTYADGTWTGAAIQEPWGDFQVSVVISNGAISSVSVVEAPTDRHSSRINSQAVPLLTESVLASQGSSVDMVSGATWTSESYTESLQSALDAAAQAA